MLVGMDVYHKTSNKGKKSIFAFVSTTDKHYSKYYSAVKIQQPGEEIGTQIQHCMIEAIKNFIELNKCKPVQVIVFRDGVSDSQRTALEAVEVQAIRQAFLKQPIKLVFLCINKQTTAKFYSKGETLMRSRGPELLGNCAPGTLISEKQICGKNDFYLISQKTNQGIASPTHYYILVNDLAEGQSELEKANIKNKLELLCYKLCYMYYNWAGSIKIPAPCQYAHQLSNFVGDRWSHQFIPQISLKKSLFFI